MKRSHITYTIGGAHVLTAALIFYSVSNPKAPKLAWELSALYGALVLQYLLALCYFGNSRDPKELAPLIGSSILSRAILVITPVTLTGDLPRYIWEGMMIRSGINPYLFAPDSPALTHLRDPNWELVEHSHLSAIYPPIAELCFSIFASDILAWKWFLFLIECLALIIIAGALKRKGLPLGRILYYALLPLALIEISLSGHVDGLLVPILAWSVQLVSAGSIFVLALCFALGILAKYVILLPLGVTGILMFKKKLIIKPALLGLSTVLIVLIGFIPFLEAGESIFSSLTTYLDHWRFNDSILHLTGTVFGVDWQRLETFTTLKKALSISWLIILAALLWRSNNYEKITAYSLATFLLIGAVFHPWYALWFAPLLCFFNSKALLYLVIALPLSYYSRLYGVEELPAWLKIVEFAPVYALLLYEISVSHDCPNLIAKSNKLGQS